MPRFSRLGAASIGLFGLGAASRPVLITVDYLVVAGGGTPGYSLTAGGGGQVQWSSVAMSTIINHAVVAGGVASASSFNGLVSSPGSPGGDVTPSSGGWGGNGGFGGTAGNGNGGGNGTHATYWDGYSILGEGYGGGGAGGAGGGGGDAWTDNPYGYYTYGGVGGPGLAWPVNGLTYGAGRGGAISDTTAGDRGGASGSCTGVYGFSNTQGCVIASYVCPNQLYTGGTVTSVGAGLAKRWFHTFPGSVSTNLVPRYF